MRPHVLELSAFGAFPGDVRLDLDELGQSGLVLLCGDTGGGKTTLLDALGFALYGVVPGERQKAREDLRSHHAAPDAVARVRLELTARGRRLRVTRTPAQHRPKKRGEGTVLDNPTALLERQAPDGTWEPIATRPEDVGHEIGLLLGMDASQFFQVVVLPQGRFAAFLQADHKDREKLLKQLFHVDRFESVERWLADRSTASQAAVHEARGALQQLAARVGQEAGADVPADPESAPDWVAELVLRASELSTAATTEAARLAGARTAAEAALAAAEALAAEQAARRAAEAELVVLEAELPEVVSLQQRLDDAVRAQPVAVAAAAFGEVEAEVAALADGVERALADVELCGGSRVDVVAQATAADADARRLHALVEVQQQAAEADRQARAAELTLHATTAALVACRERLEAMPEQRRALQAEVDAARAAALRVAPLQTRLRDATERRDLHDRLVVLEAEQVALQADAVAARAAAIAAAAEADRVRVARIDGLVAELAHRLEADAPCPVCGSCVHPVVPVLQPDDVSGLDRSSLVVARETEQVAVAAARAAESAAVTADRAVAVHAERVVGIVSQLAGLAAQSHRAAGADATGAIGATDDSDDAHSTYDADDTDDTDETHDADDTRATHEADDTQGTEGDPVRRLRSLLEAATTTAGGLADAEERLVLASTEQEACVADLGRLEVLEQEQGKRVDELDGQVVDLRASLVAAGVDPTADLAAQHRAALLLATACDTAGRAESALRAVRSSRDRAAATVASLVAAGGFADATAALTCLLDDAAAAQARTRVERHTAALAAVRGRLAVLLVDLDVEPPVVACAEAMTLAVAAHEVAVGEAQVRARRSEALSLLQPAWEAALAALAPLLERAATVRRLADLAAGRGDNRLSMSLSTFVLAARLEEVAHAASLRLSRMSEGRYTLRHSDVGRDRRSRAGLGLTVEDVWTGRGRDTATLSGGETFMTALSLALGLADVVTAESGGRTIDALFVDEGFGTLDAGTLDHVMDVLDDLRSGGRLVGVVSHVAELRQRIPTRIEVHKGPRGSSIVTT